MACPAYDCSGPANRVHEVNDPASVRLPDTIWADKGNKTLWHCNYCGFLWFTYMIVDAPKPFLMRQPVGFYDNFAKPGEFFATPNYRLKSEPIAKARKGR
jgi:hypothetical protein